MPITEEVHGCTGQASTQIENFSESLIQMSGHLRELKYKGKYLSVIHKSGRGRLRERSLTGFTMLVVTRAGRLREWSQGEL